MLKMNRLLKLPRFVYRNSRYLSTSVHESIDIDESLRLLSSYTDAELDTKKKVFILQPKMQYLSKARQSMDANVQLEESISLVKTLNDWVVVGSHVVSTKRPASKTVWGSGNISTLAREIGESGADCLFVGIDKLTRSQIENLRKEFASSDENFRVYDRYSVVLKIFKKNAKSNIAKLQIALAEIPYIRYKFSNAELHQELEKKIREEIKRQQKIRDNLNRARRRLDLPIISVLGYTNVGKTSLIKYLTKDEAMKPENKLFATLDVTYHALVLPNSGLKVILVDTIGFISDIPTTLIEAFRVTLQDALDADLYVHVLDASSAVVEEQNKVVFNTLESLECGNKLSDMLVVYNKYDKVKNTQEISHLLNENENSIAVSCQNGYQMDKLVDLIEERIQKIKNYLELRLQIRQGSEEQRFLYKSCAISEIKPFESDQNFVEMKILFDKKTAFRFMKLYPHVKICE
jgi:small GTP-binding protein